MKKRLLPSRLSKGQKRLTAVREARESREWQTAVITTANGRVYPAIRFRKAGADTLEWSCYNHLPGRTIVFPGRVTPVVTTPPTRQPRRWYQFWRK